MDTPDIVATLHIEESEYHYYVVDNEGKVYYDSISRFSCEGFIAGMKYAQDNIFSIW